MAKTTYAAHGESARYALSMRCRALAGSALLVALAPVAAHADAAPAAPAAGQPAAPTVGTDEIIVTAFKRSESSLKVPAAIQVLGGNDLRTVGVNSVTDVQNLVTGVTIGTGTFGTNVSIRGVTSTDQTSKGELGIAFNIDGAFIGRGQEEGVAFFDIERVEVLKGPQGTLYGRSSSGGAINVITKAPEIGHFNGYARFEVGNYNTRRGEGAVNVPINDMLALRLAGNFNQRDGYLTPVNTTVTGDPTATGGSSYALSAAGLPAKNDQSDQTGRASLLFKPTSDITFKAIATIGHQGGAGNSAAIDDNLKQGGSAAFDIIPNYIPSFVNVHFRNFNEQLNWKFGGVQLDVLGNEQHFTDHSQNTANGNPFDTGAAHGPPGVVLPAPAAQFALEDYSGVFNTTQFEARLSNVDKGPLDYVAGANYYHEHINESDTNWNAPVATVTNYNTWNLAIDPLNVTQHKSYGFFAQATYHFNDKLSVVGGGRYTHDQNGRVGTFAVGNPCIGANGQPTTYPNNCIGGPNNGTESDHKITWKAGINYQLTPNNLIYGTVSTGFKGGGFNDFDPSTNSTAAYGPEELTAYELGFKGRPLPGLTFTSSLYYYDYSKDQINGLVLFGTANGVVGVLYTKVVPTEIYGWENDLRYQVDKDTSLSASVAYNHTRIVSLLTGNGGNPFNPTYADFRDYQLPNSPKWTINLGATHNFALNDGAEIRARVNTKISSSYVLTDYANAVQFTQPSFTRTQASLTYATAADRVTVQLFVENIENKLQRTSGPNGYNGAYGGYTGSVPSAEVANSVYPTQALSYGVTLPRLFGVRIGTKF